MLLTPSLPCNYRIGALMSSDIYSHNSHFRTRNSRCLGGKYFVLPYIVIRVSAWRGVQAGRSGDISAHVGQVGARWC
jgi:hypothetical protein